MRRPRTLRFAAACTCSVYGWLFFGSTSLDAQEFGRAHLTLAAGVSLYDFGGADEESRLTGSGVVIAARLSYYPVTVVGMEFSIGYFEISSDDLGSIRSLLPEIGFHLTVPRGVVRPYVGLGGGLDVRLQEGTGATVHGVAGIRVLLARR